MTAPEAARARAGGAPGDWFAQARRLQNDALLAGPTVVSSTGPYGVGGLGQHMAELVQVLRERGDLAAYISPRADPDETQGACIELAVPRWAARAGALPPFRSSHGWRILLGNVAFDRAGARRLPAGPENLLVFNGHALRHLAVARRRGYRTAALVSANPHLAHQARRHELAHRQYPIEPPFAPRLVARNRAEYEAADFVHVPSRYAWQSFLEEGFPQERLRLFPLTPAPRFRVVRPAPTAPTFNVVFIGILSVHKGVPLLIDAFARLAHEDLRLVLVGGWSTRSMRLYLERALARDRRIQIAPGDPLPHLLQAGVCVHPSYSEGCAYAPGEAQACGVPLIASADTGMNEAIGDPAQRMVVPTGDVDALAHAIDAAYRGSWPVRGTRSEAAGRPARG